VQVRVWAFPNPSDCLQPLFDLSLKGSNYKRHVWTVCVYSRRKRLTLFFYKNSPRLVPKSAKLLEDQYVRYRQEMRERAKKGGAPAVPITVRQLEAITRVR
jgi:DNA replicative helicase MCM subunit Mcm2 (Cdc46/Mcm family)